MLEKIKGLVGSLRFWIITLTMILSELQLLAVSQTGITGINFVEALGILKVYLIAVVSLGTMDKVASNLGEAISKK